MTPAAARRIALSLPEAVERAHMGTADFRVGGKIFATLHPTEHRAVVKLRPGEQELLVAAEPAVFSPVKGAWGSKGWTNVNLASADATTLKSALTAGWRNVAPKRLLPRP